ncbi:MAG TPA: EamA family transporter [Elusimicrobiota bacterium]|nr:EamA family transporter [Elusimicrobiota bacterium]
MTSFWIAIIAALIWGATAIVEKMGLRDADPMAGLWARCMGATAGILLLTAAWPPILQHVAKMGIRSFTLLATSGLAAAVVGQLFFYKALKTGEIGRITALSGSWPLVAFLLSLALGRESLTPQKFIGVVLVVAGMAFLKQ